MRGSINSKVMLTVALFCLLILNTLAQSPQVKIENGIIEGIADSQAGLELYLGVPFAKPPVGDLRWRAPQPLENWVGVRQTKAFGPSAKQINIFGDMIYRSNGTSEDCLYLNVWTPAKKVTKGLPVLVYFYGGGFVAGDGSEPRYDGASTARRGVVVVTVNYRLSIFGFFAHPELSKEAPYKASGNYGLLDQHEALKWVQKNIAAFGGDPKRVTIAGESAGSISVSAQMASPLSRNLIAGAIGESGAGIKPTLPPIPLAEAEQNGLEFAEKSGYRTLAQLRALSTDELFDVYSKSKRFGFPLVIDNYFFPGTITEIFNEKKQAHVPLLVGWNSAEIDGMGFMQGLPYTKENFVSKVKEVYPEEYEEALKVLPHSTVKEVEWSATNLASDRFIAYSAWKWFDLHRKNSNQKVYRYLYSKLRPPRVGEAGTVTTAIGAPHACEIEYCLGNLDLIKEFAWTKEDYKVSETMQNYFVNFIKTGDPNGNNLPEWPAAKPTDVNPPVMIFDVESKAVIKDDARYQFLDKSYGNN